MFRQYINIRVHRDINVSSSGHYTAHVTYTQMRNDGTIGRTWSRHFMPDNVGFLALEPHQGDWKAPKYVIDQTCLGLLSLHDKGKLRFYEYDQERNKRFEELRYHEIDAWNWIIKHMRERVK